MSETEIHQPEILGRVHLDREPDSDEFARGLENFRRYSFLPNSVAPVVTQLNSRRCVRPYFREQGELSRPPINLCDKKQRAQNCEKRNGRATEVRFHSFCPHPRRRTTALGRVLQQLRNLSLNVLELVQSQAHVRHDKDVAGLPVFVNQDRPAATLVGLDLF